MPLNRYIEILPLETMKYKIANKRSIEYKNNHIVDINMHNIDPVRASIVLKLFKDLIPNLA